MAFAHPEFLVATDWLAERLADDDVAFSRQPCSCIYATDAAASSPGEGSMRRDTFPDRASSTFRPIFPTTPTLALHDALGQRICRGRRGSAASRSRQSWSSTTAWGRSGRPRLWWMFRSMGCEGVAVLDGGWRRWTAEGRAVSTDVATYAPTTFTPTADPARFADFARG